MKEPFARFFFRDWQACSELQVCEDGSKGIWMNLMCLMAQSERYGYLELAGKPLDVDTVELAKLAYTTKDRLEAALQDLGNHRVFSRDESGVIYSRRMVKDHADREAFREFGARSGGNPALRGKAKRARKAKAIPDANATPTPIPNTSEPIGGAIPPAIPLSEFDQFWQAYPRKTGKKAAQKAWDNATGRPGIDAILKAIEQQRKCQQWVKDGGQFIPHPATWLNQGRWADEPIMASNRTPVAAIPEYSEEFDAFFGLYPAAGRVEKAEAWRAWQEVLPSILAAAGGDMKAWLVKVVNKLKAQAKEPRWTELGGKYIPKPANYLRNGGWEE